MKRFISLFLLSIIYVASMAQNERMPFGNKTVYRVNQHKYNQFHKGNGTPTLSLFYDDFEGDGYQLTQKWEILRSGSLDFQAVTEASTPKWFWCTPQSFNGNGATYIKHGEGSVAISYTAPDFTWLISLDTLAIPADHETFLRFWLWYYSNYTQNYITNFYTLVYNVDNQSLDTLLYLGKDSITSIPNQYKTLINISLLDYAGKNIRLAFVYENRNNQNMGTQLALDDVTITNLNIPDIQLTAIPLTYSKVPYTTFDSLLLNIKTSVYNLGNRLTDTLTISSSCDKVSGFSSTIKISDTLETGDQRVVVFNDKLLVKPNIDSYTISIAAATPPDTITENNSDETSFEITNDIYSTDRGVVGGISFGNSTAVGNLFEINKTCFIKGAQIGWGNNPGTIEENYPLNFYIEVLEVNPALPNDARSVAMEVFQKSFSVLGGTGDYIFSKPIYCKPGFKYYINVIQTTDLPLGIGYDGNSYGFFWKTVNYYPFNVSLMSNQSIGNLAIRAIIGAPVQNPTVYFSILNQQKEPATNVKIKISEIDSTLRTNDQGQVSIKLDNGQYTYRIDSSGYYSIDKKFSVFSQDVVIIDSLQKNYKVKFRVLDVSETPLQNAIIISYPYQLTTNQNGEDSLSLPNGVYPVNVLLSNYKMQNFDEVVVNNSDTLITIYMEAAATYNLTVAVKDNYDVNIPNAKVRIDDYGALNTNSEGICTFNGLLPGAITGSVYVDNYFPGSIYINLDSDSTFTVKMQPEYYRVTFYVTSKGSPIINANIVVNNSDTVYTNISGYAYSYQPFGSNIPYSVSVKDYYTYTGTFNLWNDDSFVTVNLTPLGIGTEHNQISPSIYPNPATDFIDISFTDDYTILIFDINGKIVYNRRQTENRVNLSHLPKGLFIVKLITRKGYSTHKLIKQ